MVSTKLLSTRSLSKAPLSEITEIELSNQNKLEVSFKKDYEQVC